MAKTLIDVDVELLVQTQRILGAKTKKDAVNSALREIVRREAAVRFVACARDGMFSALMDSEAGPV